MTQLLDGNRLKEAFAELDSLLKEPVRLLVGGGAAMVLLYGETEATHDVDAIPIRSRLTMEDLKKEIILVAEKLGLAKDWMNPYFGSFTHNLPADYESRSEEVFKGKYLTCIALGPEDLLIMKLMAGRKKDERHIRRLMLRKEINFSIVESRLNQFEQKSIPGSIEAMERFEESKEALGF